MRSAVIPLAAGKSPIVLVVPPQHLSNRRQLPVAEVKNDHTNVFEIEEAYERFQHIKVIWF